MLWDVELPPNGNVPPSLRRRQAALAPGAAAHASRHLAARSRVRVLYNPVPPRRWSDEPGVG
eukprot:2063884-Prorocentrum_lima.AAC.1